MVLMFTQDGCPACDAAYPEWERFKARNPLAMALSFDADGPYPANFGLKKIRATPFYVLKNGDEGVTHEGAMKAEALEKWVKTSMDSLS